MLSNIIYYFYSLDRKRNKRAKFLFHFIFSGNHSHWFSLRIKYSSVDLLLVLDQRGRGEIEDFFVPSGESPVVACSTILYRTWRTWLGFSEETSLFPRTLFRTSRYLNAQDNCLGTEKHGESHVSLRATRRFSIRWNSSSQRSTRCIAYSRNVVTLRARKYLSAPCGSQCDSHVRKKNGDESARFGERGRERIKFTHAATFQARLLGILCFRGRKVFGVRPRSRSARQINRARTVSGGIANKWTFLERVERAQIVEMHPNEDTLLSWRTWRMFARESWLNCLVIESVWSEIINKKSNWKLIGNCW